MDKEMDKSIEGENMSVALSKIPKRKNLDELKQRAEARKLRRDLRHQATEEEIKIYNDDFRDLEIETYKTIK